MKEENKEKAFFLNTEIYPLSLLVFLGLLAFLDFSKKNFNLKVDNVRYILEVGFTFALFFILLFDFFIYRFLDIQRDRYIEVISYISSFISKSRKKHRIADVCIMLVFFGMFVVFIVLFNSVNCIESESGYYLHFFRYVIFSIGSWPIFIYIFRYEERIFYFKELSEISTYSYGENISVKKLIFRYSFAIFTFLIIFIFALFFIFCVFHYRKIDFLFTFWILLSILYLFILFKKLTDKIVKLKPILKDDEKYEDLIKKLKYYLDKV